MLTLRDNKSGLHTRSVGDVQRPPRSRNAKKLTCKRNCMYVYVSPDCGADFCSDCMWWHMYEFEAAQAPQSQLYFSSGMDKTSVGEDFLVFNGQRYAGYSGMNSSRQKVYSVGFDRLTPVQAEHLTWRSKCDNENAHSAHITTIDEYVPGRHQLCTIRGDDNPPLCRCNAGSLASMQCDNPNCASDVEQHGAHFRPPVLIVDGVN